MTTEVYEVTPWPAEGQFWLHLSPLYLFRVKALSEDIHLEITPVDVWSPQGDGCESSVISFDNARYLWFERRVPRKALERFKTRTALNVVSGDVLLASPDIEYVPPPPPPPRPPPDPQTHHVFAPTTLLTTSIMGSAPTLSFDVPSSHFLIFIGPETTDNEIQILADWNPLIKPDHYGIQYLQRGLRSQSHIPKTALERILSADD